MPVGSRRRPTGNVYVSDHDNRIRRIDPRGVVHAFAGAGPIPAARRPAAAPSAATAGRASRALPRARGSRGRPCAATSCSRTAGTARCAGSAPTARSRPWRESASPSVLRSTAPAGSMSRPPGVCARRPRTAWPRCSRGSRSAAPSPSTRTGDLFVAQADENVVRRVDPQGKVTTLRGPAARATRATAVRGAGRARPP